MAKASAPQIDNEIYNRLGDRWYDAWDDPVALLRRESIVKLAWMKERLPAGRLKILDQGCGAGLVANELASWEHEVTGVDVSESSLQVGRERDKTQSVDYICTDALNTGLEEESYDVIVNFDFLEHVDNPAAAVAEASRLLKPGGHFYFHTFNRNLMSYFLAIKIVEWLVPQTPKNMHVLHLFIKPKELESMMTKVGLDCQEMTGLLPKLFNWSTLKGVFQRRVPEDFEFKCTPSTMVSYMGYAIKK